MNILEKIKYKIIAKKEVAENLNYRYHSIVSETLPLYHDRFRTTNKSILKLTSEDDRVNKVRLETQDGLKVKFHKDFDESSSKDFCGHTGLPGFQKADLKQGLIVNIDGNGFLENENSVYEVVLLTDRFAYFRNLELNSIYPNSYEEIERMRNVGALKVDKIL